MTVLYENVKMLCKKNSISIRQLEKETGITQNTISNWAHTYPTCDKVLKVANYFSVSVDSLLNNVLNNIEFEQRLSPRMSNLIKMVDNSNLEEDDIEIALEVAEKYKKHFKK